MATLVLTAAGGAIGGALGGTALGLSTLAWGQFAGAVAGRWIDQKLLGRGSEAVERGRVDRFRLTGVGEGAARTQVHGRMRVPGHVIWASPFTEEVRSHGGGKGAPSRPKTKSYSYRVSLAVALCEGEITGVTRVWADGVEVPAQELTMRVYPGTGDQLPDPKIEAVEGAGLTPAYRGTAYVVLEDMTLEPYGNRVPQLNFEVTRPVQRDADGAAHAITYGVRGVAMMPGTGEYALATEPVFFDQGGGKVRASNVNSPSGLTDFETSLEMLRAELPECRATSLVVSWFGDDLRCGECRLRPKVEQQDVDGSPMPWSVAGLDRASAQQITQEDGRPVYGGTPSDASVVQAIAALRGAGQDVMFYPFILMEQGPGNGLSDPYSGAADQPVYPWRGRITLSVAPGQPGTPDQTAVAADEVAAFFGTASAADFSVAEGRVSYSGPEEWSYRRFILHNAALCAAAGGVAAFCIGSEMRGLTQIRAARTVFPAVVALRELAAEVRALLGPEVKIGYAADWSEYFGYHPQDGSGDVLFHLDPLWADDDIDFVGIDNYMPLSDWRDGEDHADAAWGAIYNLDYLRANIEGGEGYEWYYTSEQARAAQIRTPLQDGAHGEDWVFRYKDMRNWWARAHHDRVGGVREAEPTAWVPGSKPIWLTEIGCAAIDKGTNQPNKFLDPKSSESRVPVHSSGARDELIQMQYLEAMASYWADPVNNPVAELYDGRMLDLDRVFVWAWDARPYPHFPARQDVWSDGANYARGHWISGRTSARSLASVVRELCVKAGVQDIDVSRLYGYVRGYVVADAGSARDALQPLMLHYGFDAVDRDGVLVFRMRNGRGDGDLVPERLAVSPELDATWDVTREAEAEVAGRLRLDFIEADGDFDMAAEEVVLPGEASHSVAGSEVALALTRGEARRTLERWLSEAQVAREGARFALPPSSAPLGAGDVVVMPGGAGEGRWRIDRVTEGPHRLIEAVRVEPEVYRPGPVPETGADVRMAAAPVPPLALFMDLPLLGGDEVPHAPYLAVTSDPWPGSVALYAAESDEDYALDTLFAARATVGLTETPLYRAPAGIVDPGPALKVRLTSGLLESVPQARLLGGANLAAIGDGTPDGWEVFQFRNASLGEDGAYDLTGRLRGQAGTDALMPDSWPAGSYVVLLDGVPAQIALKAAQRGLERHYRVGPARRPYDDPTYRHHVLAFAGNGLRPLSPVHLRAGAGPDGALDLSWIRRTRVDGDGWGDSEVPLGEERELYRVSLRAGGVMIRQAEVTEPFWRYDATAQAEDSGVGVLELGVAQVSGRFGPGPEARLGLQAP